MDIANLAKVQTWIAKIVSHTGKPNGAAKIVGVMGNTVESKWLKDVVEEEECVTIWFLVTG